MVGLSSCAAGLWLLVCLCVKHTERWVQTMLARSWMQHTFPFALDEKWLEHRLTYTAAIVAICRNIFLQAKPKECVGEKAVAELETTFSSSRLWKSLRLVQPVNRQKPTITVHQPVLDGSAGWTKHPAEQLWSESSLIHLILTECEDTWPNQLNLRQKEFGFSLCGFSQRESSRHWRDCGFIFFFQHILYKRSLLKTWVWLNWTTTVRWLYHM